MITTRCRAKSEAVLACEAGDIAVVQLHRAGGLADAVQFGRRGFRIVICLGSSADDEAQLKALAPTNFVLRATTEGELLKALHASFS